jgi:hypothetical protein
MLADEVNENSSVVIFIILLQRKKGGKQRVFTVSFTKIRDI